MSANAEMLHMYWDIGLMVAKNMVAKKQDAEGWGAAVIPRLAVDLRNDLPEIKGFSERNLGRMIAFFRAYSNLDEILPQPVAKLNQKQKQGPANLPQAVAKTGHADAMKGLLAGPQDSLGAQYSADGKGKRCIRTPVVHGASLGKWLEPRHAHGGH